jgi:hypothetical protein
LLAGLGLPAVRRLEGELAEALDHAARDPESKPRRFSGWSL